VLKKLGEQATLTRRDIGTPNVTSGKAAATTADAQVYSTPPLEHTEKIDDDGNVVTGLRAILEAGADPDVGDRLELAGSLHGVVWVKKISDRNGVVAWEVLLGDVRDAN